ncbi:hypothetical protein D0A34_21340 [Microcoleus vaginatus PCC 9802]|uniref:hypothetical protein n=1 Tax=Microcoleus vaginatus TaxID=119532 RepID=UPI00020D2E86|nr:hypothetical protein MicvaDRAFT_4897 [Microcoleus vaginatus FGP-2]UNU21040.1 hypothetical protein D0A34_21340 [Microcoleus vaginatus PCC 9802]
MSDSNISLIVITYEDWQSWRSSCCYEKEWPGCHWAYFLKAGEAIQKLDVEKCKRIYVSPQAKVSEVIREARKHFAGFDKDRWEPSQNFYGYKEDPDFDYAISYSMYYPAANDGIVSEDTRISKLGILEDDLIVIRKINHKPYNFGVQYCMAFVKHFDDFQEMVLNGKDSRKDRYTSFSRDTKFDVVLLYTDEDVELAKYIREHLDELHQMSGSDTTVYVVEAPHGKIHAAEFWKARLEQKAYYAWSLLGWTRSSPYNKSETYKIARSLGIYPNTFPCLVVSHKNNYQDKVTLPIFSDFSNFFRNFFTNMQRSVDELENGARFSQQELLSQLRNAMEQVERAEPIEKQPKTARNLQPGVIIMAEKPIFNINQQGATIGVGVATEGSNVRFVQHAKQNVNIPEQDLVEATQKIQDLLSQLSLSYPISNTNEQETFIQKFFELLESTPDLVKVLFAGGIEGLKILCPPAGIPIEMTRRLYDSLQERYAQI